MTTKKNSPKKTKAKRKAGPAKKAPRTRTGSKTAAVLELLKRPGGVSAQALMKATGWQAHSVRGFLSGTVTKKMGLRISSVKGENSERIYSVKA